MTARFSELNRRTAQILLPAWAPVLLLTAGLLLAVPGHASEAAEQQFKALYEKDAAFRKQEYAAATDDDEEAGADLSDAAERRRMQVWQGMLNEADAIPLAELSSESRINWRIFRDQLRNRVDRVRYDAHLLAFNSDSQFWAGHARAGETARCKTVGECEQHLKRLARLPRAFDEKIALLKLGIQRGMTQPQVVLTGRDESIRRHIVEQAEQSVFYTPFTRLPASMSADDQKRLQQQARELISKQLVPAYRKLLGFIQKEYIPQARKGIAAYELPNGKAFYQSQVFEYTTLDLTPEQIHDIGLAEVARIRSDMADIIHQVNFQGDFAAFLHFLRTDPQFFAKSERELLAEASYWAKKADGELVRFFGLLPRKPYGVEAVPADIAPTYTAGRYAGSGDAKRPSYYWVNTSLLDQRPLWALPALTLHEGVPGHHLQIALAAEQGEQPEFRRNAYISAFGEGWGLYAERLGMDMNYYETPYQHFGRLVYEMWRAARLVVDTGMHAKGWSRDQALQFMRENTALSEHEITTEIDRYVSWPGQALAYKLGEITIRDVRKHAENELGEKFDIRAFHDKLLSLGSVPLSVLESEMRNWTAQQKNPPAAASTVTPAHSPK